MHRTRNAAAAAAVTTASDDNDDDVADDLDSNIFRVFLCGGAGQMAITMVGAVVLEVMAIVMEQAEGGSEHKIFF